TGNAVVRAIDGEAGDGNSRRISDQQRGGDRSGVEQARGIGLHGRRLQGGAVVGIDFKRLANVDLFGVEALANVDFVARRGGIDGSLNAAELGIRAFQFVVVDDKPAAVGGT